MERQLLKGCGMIRGSEKHLGFGIVRAVTEAARIATSLRRFGYRNHQTAFSLARVNGFSPFRAGNECTGRFVARCARLDICGTVVEPFRKTLRLSRRLGSFALFYE
jgi:hypothetical protein